MQSTPLMKKHKVVYIEWIDSATTDPTWMSRQEAIEWGMDDTNNTIRQIGFVVKKTRKTILLASGINNETISGVFKIPLCCIKTLTFLKV